MTTPVSQGIGKHLFRLYRDEWAFMERHYQRHRRPPSPVLFKRKFPDFRLVRTDDVAALVDDVRHEHATGALAIMASDLVDSLDRGDDPLELMERITRDVTMIYQDATGEGDDEVVTNWQGIYDNVSARVERALKSGGLPGVPSGWPTLDKVTAGFQPGELWVFAARPGQGKSFSLVQIATQAIVSGYTTYYESLEQPRAEVSIRLHPFLGRRLRLKGVPANSLLKRGMVDLEAYRVFLESLAGAIDPARLYMTDASRGKVTTARLAGQLERHKPVDCVLVDYITLFKTTQKFKHGEEWRAAATVSSDLKQMAMQYNCPVIAAAQMNREFGMRGLPGPEAIANSDAIGQDADGVVTLRQVTPELTQFRLSKYRHGEGDVYWWCHFDPDKGIFDEVDEDRASSLKDQYDAGKGVTL